MRRYHPTWESLAHYRAPDWFTNAKFGIFIHWGIISVPEHGCWYGHSMYNPEHQDRGFEHHINTYGTQDKFGYKDFIPMFKGEHFDPDEWIDLCVKAGARYVVPVADFHDAFAMYDSDLTEYSAVKMGPKRNVIGEIREAALKRDLRFGVSSHLAFNWDFFAKKPEFDTWDPAYEQLYGPRHNGIVPRSFLEMYLRRTKELIDKTRPDKLWFDFGFNRPEFEPARKEIAAYYYNQALEWGREVVLTYKNETEDKSFPDGTAVLDLERGRLNEIRPMTWQTDTSVCWKDWSYRAGDEYKPIDMLIGELVDIVSKNGCLLLNIGPRADGTIPREQVGILEAFGEWLQVNGEAIYGTRPWSIYGEGPTKMIGGHMQEGHNKEMSYTGEDIRFTTSDDAFYAVFLDWPGAGRTRIKSLVGNPFMGRRIERVDLLGHGPVEWKMDHLGFFINMPNERPCNYCYSVKIGFSK